MKKCKPINFAISVKARGKQPAQTGVFPGRHPAGAFKKFKSHFGVSGFPADHETGGWKGVRITPLLLMLVLLACFGCGPQPLADQVDQQVIELPAWAGHGEHRGHGEQEYRLIDLLPAEQTTSIEIETFAFDPYATNRVALPLAMRHTNYRGGSCYYASTCTPLEHLATPKLAMLFRRANWGGASTGDVCRALDRAGVDYVVTYRGDFRVLEWANRNHLAAAITYKPGHACTFVDADPEWIRQGDGWVKNPNRRVRVLDNNFTERLETPHIEQFLRIWRNGGGGAIVPLGMPLPPEFVLEDF